MADIRKSKRTSRLSVAISVALHSVIVGVLLFFAAREGMLGTQLKKIAVTMVPKEKPPEEKPKEKPPDPKPEVEPHKTEIPVPPPQVETAKTPAAPDTVAPAIAPPAAAIPAFDFEGGKTVETSSDPQVLYKGFVEYSLRSHWKRPDGIADDDFVAEVELTVDPTGRILNYAFVKKSGNAAWDESVNRAVAQTVTVGRVPPKGFPEKILVRFDVQAPTEISLQ